MLTKGSMDQTVKKLARFADMLSERIFTTVISVDQLKIFLTTEPLHAIPDESSYAPLTEEIWGGEGVYAWFKGSFTVPESLSGKALFVWPRMDFYEATLWLNGCIHSNYANKFVEGSHGNHYCNRITAGAKAGESFALDLECYAWHMVPGTHPFKDDRRPSQNFCYACGPLDVCTRDDEVMDFVFDLNTLL